MEKLLALLKAHWNDNYFKYIVAAAALIILGGGLAYCTSANAMTIRGNQGKCVALAEDVMTISEIRDSGAKWSDLQAQLEPQFTKVVGQPDSYIKDREDFDYVMKAFEFSFQVPNVPGLDVAKAVYAHCMSKNGEA